MIVLAILLAASQPATHLSIEPWTGSDFQTTASDAAKYRLSVTGKPNSTLQLRVRGVAKGWLAAFCTPRLCSPQRIDVVLPRSGNAVFQFELIRESDGAPKQSGATITNIDGASVGVPTAYRQ
jgi:hypothetical protein